MRCRLCFGKGWKNGKPCPLCVGAKRYIPTVVADTNERYTPASYINAARTVMGGLDLDVASCELANQVVQAPMYYSRTNSGLTNPWHGRIWCNPPYGSVVTGSNSSATFQRLFIEKAISEWEKGNFTQGIFLFLGNVCFNSYFAPMWNHSLCFCKNTIWFRDPQGRDAHSGWANLFVYIGNRRSTFVEVFSEFGVIPPLGISDNG